MVKLAIDGGKRVRKKPIPARIQVGRAEIRAVTRLMERCAKHGGAFDRYGGVHVDAYEREFAKFVGTKYATAMSSGTAAVHAILGALELEPGDEVITSSITDPGAIAPILFQNAIPVFTDIEPDTFNISAKEVAKNITRRTRAIIVTHIAGYPADVRAVLKIARKRKIPVIEDVAQAHGARIGKKMVGSFGVAGAFSTMSGKHHTSGGQGGVVVTNDEELCWKAKRFADRGKPFGLDEQQNVMLGLNYRMTEIGAVIGRVQLKKLPRTTERRRAVAEAFEEGVAGVPCVRPQRIIRGGRAVYWFGVAHIDESKIKVPVERFIEAVAAEGVPFSRAYFQPVHAAPYIRRRRTYGRSGCPWTCPRGRKIDYDKALKNVPKVLASNAFWPVHESMTVRIGKDLAAAVRKVAEHYGR